MCIRDRYGANDLTDWTLISGNVDVVHQGFGGNSDSAFDGVQFIDLNGTNDPDNRAVISQSFATVFGVQYTLSFAYSSNWLSNAAKSATVNVFDAGFNNLLTHSFAHNSATSTNYDWQTYSNTFMGTGGLVTLLFSSTTTPINDNGGIFLDGVSVVPEPGSALLVGMACVFMARRRIRSRS
jgi:hypothetical protein